MSDRDTIKKIDEMHTLLVRLSTQRDADVKEMARLDAHIKQLEGRFWVIVVGLVAALGTALFDLVANAL